jgi:hypothetical protein
MPMVGDKKFAYTAKGKKEAKKYAEKTGSKTPAKKPMQMKKTGRGR